MSKASDTILALGLRAMLSIDSLVSLISWMAIVLITFLAALLADMAHLSLPIVVAIGASTLIIAILITATLLGLQQQTKAVRMIDRSPKIPLIELRSEAIRKGWDFSAGSEQTLAFTLAVSQAGLDCEVEFWGRKDRSDSEAANRNRELEAVPGGHWLQFAVEPVLFVSSQDNYYVRSYEFPSLTVKGYQDLHVNRDQALKWLNSTAESSRNSHRMHETNGSTREET